MPGDTAINRTREYRNAILSKFLKAKMLTDVFRFISDYRQSFEFIAIQIVG